ncbi:hypothetical protein [Candidatus Chlorohelix sp.]|uniref:magnesium transporter MgtE N-terminal domain-containing protein n=1 Tax=Candidatus Chlorohelix sp. TaxID=3139201 RepID=UPI00306155DB
MITSTLTFAGLFRSANQYMPLVLLSYLINTPVLDNSGKEIAALKDLSVCLNPAGKNNQFKEPHPHLTGLVAENEEEEWWIPLRQVQSFGEKEIKLSVSVKEIVKFERFPGEALLKEDILDNPLVDLQRRRVVRANDLVLNIVGNQPVIWLIAVDVSLQARLLRLIPFLSKKGGILVLDDEMLDWSEVEYLTSSAPEAHLDIQHEHLEGLSVAYLVPLLEELPPELGTEIVEDLSPKVAAAVLENIRPDCAVDILQLLKEEDRLEIFTNMSPVVANRLSEVPDRLL